MNLKDYATLPELSLLLFLPPGCLWRSALCATNARLPNPVLLAEEAYRAAGISEELIQEFLKAEAGSTFDAKP